MADTIRIRPPDEGNRGIIAVQTAGSLYVSAVLIPVQGQVNGRDPRQYGLDFGLWTRAIVAQLIEQKFGIKLGLTAVGELLAKLGPTPQKPLQRAYQRDPEAIEKWQGEVYPAIARKARSENADVFFCDESGFRADAVHGKTWGVRGRRLST